MQIIKLIANSLQKRPLLWGGLLLITLTTLNNWPVSFFDFAWDDIVYVIRNYPIQDPVSFKTLKWCLTEFSEANWHPLTWFALNIQFNYFGLDPRGYHIVNLFLHIANVVLLYCALWRMTGSTGKSLVVSALFAVHPLHVESIAWISEIKDMLSTFFLMITLHAYISYARRSNILHYSFIFCSLALGLMSKPMLVTTPFALLLLDMWPMGRWVNGPKPAHPQYACPRHGLWQLLLEKLPLLVLVAGTSILTYLAQLDGKAVASLDVMPLSIRLANMANSYAMYLWRMLWPWPLSFFYPFTQISPIRIFSCTMALIGISLIVFYLRRSKPYAAVGWLWFLGTLVPVIGLIQVGSQALADRYTYIPSIGLFLAVVWLSSDVLDRLRLNRLLAPVLAGAIVFAYMLVSFEYLGHWANETELYEYALSVDNQNVVAHNNYANILSARGETEKAEEHYKSVLKYTPNSMCAVNNLARLLNAKGKTEEAQRIIQAAITINPYYPISFLNMANFRAQSNDLDAAEQLLRHAHALDAKDISTINILAELLTQRQKDDEALALYSEGLAKAFDKDPIKAFIYNNIGVFWFKRHDYPKAAEAFESALTLQPKFPLASHNLTRVYLAQQDFTSAEKQLRKILALIPKDAIAWSMLGDIFLDRHQFGRAYVQFRRAMAIGNAPPDTHEGMAVILRAFGQPDLADIHAAKAGDLRVLLRPSPAIAKADATSGKPQ
jgi:protein O-mannosyl-transferase